MSENQQAPTTRRYSAEFKERAVRMVRQLREETGEKKGTIGRVAGQLGCGTESLRSWVRQDDINRGERPGPGRPSTAERLARSSTSRRNPSRPGFPVP